MLSLLKERFAQLQAWLFPRRVYLELQDTAITAMALEGRQVVWLERVLLPEGICVSGVPCNKNALGDLLGDWLLARGYGGARVRAVLPFQATALRLLQGEPSLGADQRTGMQWPWPADTPLDLISEPLPSTQGLSLVVAVKTALLESWMDVFTIAALRLDRLEAAPLCAGLGADAELVLLVEADGCVLFRFVAGVPHWQWLLPPAQPTASFRRALALCLANWPEQRSLRLVVAAGAGLEPLALGHELQQGLPVRVDVPDPFDDGTLLGFSAESELVSLALLCGLVSADQSC